MVTADVGADGADDRHVDRLEILEQRGLLGEREVVEERGDAAFLNELASGGDGANRIARHVRDQHLHRVAIEAALRVDVAHPRPNGGRRRTADRPEGAGRGAEGAKMILLLVPAVLAATPVEDLPPPRPRGAAVGDRTCGSAGAQRARSTVRCVRRRPVGRACAGRRARREPVGSAPWSPARHWPSAAAPS